MEKKIVLAIDDNTVDLNTLQGILSDDYLFSAVTSASAALSFLNSNKVDIILLDIVMPNISGFEFLYDIRKIPSYIDVPIIIVSSKNGEDFFKEARNSSAFDVVSKPVLPNRLISIIEKALANTATRTES